jgi:hypothetical protein
VTRRRRLATLLLAAPALAASACGGPSDEERIKGVIQDVAKDVATICDHASERLLDEQLGGDRAACEERSRAAPDDSSKTIAADTIDVQVHGDTATADFTDNRGDPTHVTFVKDGGEWLVDSSR